MALLALRPHGANFGGHNIVPVTRDVRKTRMTIVLGMQLQLNQVPNFNDCTRKCAMLWHDEPAPHAGSFSK